MHKGYTLIELVVTMAIIAVIGSIAFPSYRAYIVRGNRVVAKTVLGEVQSRQETFMLDRKRYAPSLVALGYPADPVYVLRNGETQGAASAEATYELRLENVAARSFAVAAIPLNAQLRDTDCATLRIKSTGKKEATGSSGLKCWR